jgi:putative NADH-flavin reductase
VNRPAELAEVIQGHEALVSAVGPSAGDGGETTPLSEAARRLIDAARTAQIPRLVHVCSEQALCAASGRLIVTAAPPQDLWKAVARSRFEVFHVLLAAKDLDCTFVAPAAFVDYGRRTGGYRRGGGALIVDSGGRGRISMDDFAIAIVDELQKPKQLRQRYVLIY